MTQPRTIIKNIPGKKTFEVFIISGTNHLKIVSYANAEILAAINTGTIKEVPAERIIEDFTSLRLADLLKGVTTAKYYEP